MLIKNGKKEKHNKDDYDIIAEIRKTSNELRLNSIWFSDEKNHDLIKACIYERESLLSKYSYLINEAKKSQLKHNLKEPY